ncbi:hypothetical protein AMAG_08097 [Allomyces macrogynus ATCC 38327]|uniref:SUN domain-containing protein n=1 Tax=Allomyces macrogynus (strain ATCC 38327) TaxID=578462 RepID=A0A0L0SKI1_ALLM3|nr:hypothetical protein AMAG_08097 [Allomyces macrogynus ATCC 38327]|eukprot:KNE62919.1 hypothetical protein AMAG_08097 [Allomyces macrogynus ATCC 38327]
MLPRSDSGDSLPARAEPVKNLRTRQVFAAAAAEPRASPRRRAALAKSLDPPMRGAQPPPPRPAAPPARSWLARRDVLGTPAAVSKRVEGYESSDEDETADRWDQRQEFANRHDDERNQHDHQYDEYDDERYDEDEEYDEDLEGEDDVHDEDRRTYRRPSDPRAAIAAWSADLRTRSAIKARHAAQSMRRMASAARSATMAKVVRPTVEITAWFLRAEHRRFLLGILVLLALAAYLQLQQHLASRLPAPSEYSETTGPPPAPIPDPLAKVPPLGEIVPPPSPPPPSMVIVDESNQPKPIVSKPDVELPPPPPSNPPKRNSATGASWNPFSGSRRDPATQVTQRVADTESLLHQLQEHVQQLTSRLQALEAEYQDSHAAMVVKLTTAQTRATEAEANLLKLQQSADAHDAQWVHDHVVKLVESETAVLTDELATALQRARDEARQAIAAAQDAVRRAETLHPAPVPAQPPLRLCMPDYALLSAGARVIHPLTAPTLSWPSRSRILRWLRLGRTYAHPPETAFMPVVLGTTTPARSSSSSPSSAVVADPTAVVGRCWSMSGASGAVTIELARPVPVEAVTVAHLARAVTVDFGSAPRTIRAYAVYDLPSTMSRFANTSASSPRHAPESLDAIPLLHPRDALALRRATPHRVLLAEFVYDDRGTKDEPADPTARVLAYMTVPVREAARAVVAARPVTHVAFAIAENHGHPAHTCVYRLQVHAPPPSQAEGTQEGADSEPVKEADLEQPQAAAVGQVNSDPDPEPPVRPSGEELEGGVPPPPPMA